MDISPASGIAQAVFMPSTPPANQQARPAALASVAPVDDAVLQRALDTVNLQMQAIPSNIQFSLDKDNGKIIVKVVDSQTNTVLLQIPSEEMLGISKSLDKLQGLLIRVKA